ncbi:hypothetical protein LARI1_G005456 [Lachnellula arida]|uniref:Rhodopsin domain-containing protein n=1 Tax=Lachnellula arida TaxID=1316785 RepID=A0A8T9BAI2_9HELO|nr:hypothetical protein LARI1_G005456 [Lachnellula arida]
MSQSTTTDPLMLIPGLAPPPGVIPNFVNPYSIAPTIRGLGDLFLILICVTSILRFYTRFFVIKDHGWADYTMLAAWLGYIAYYAVSLVTFRYGAGIHQWNVPARHVILLARWGNIFEIIYSIIILLAKLSICLQLQHIFIPDHNTKRFWCLQVFIWINTSWFIACFFISIFQCNPRERIWNPTVKGTCLNYQKYILVTAIFNCTSDVLMLFFPLFSVWNLRMSMKRKIGISAIFLVGLLALTASILRVVYSVQNNGSQDATFTSVQVAICTGGEITAGIMVGNLVVLPRFFTTSRDKAKQLFSSYRFTLSSRKPKSQSDQSWPRRTPYDGLPDQQSSKALHENSMELRQSGSASNASNQTGMMMSGKFLDLRSETENSVSRSMV